jgi:2-deoxy-D-gluconate 3-dehydrogenase
MQSPFRLEGKVAIVTGGNGGIGKGMAMGLAEAGCKIVIAARNPDKTETALRELEQKFGAIAAGIQVDLRKEKEIPAMVQKAKEAFGRIDILINNAGTGIRKMPQDYTLEDWDEIMNTNLRSAFLCSQAVYPHMKAVGGGKIINIGSMTSIFGGAKYAIYGASKGGIVQLTRALAVAWAPDHIQVNAILPGWIETDLTVLSRKAVPTLDQNVKERTPMGRWGRPSDLAGAAVFLSSPASDFITGVALPVDGGYSVFLC